MNRTLVWVILIVVVGAIGAALYYRSQQTALRAVPPAAQSPGPKPQPEPAIRYPVEEKPPEQPLPTIDKSDPTMRETLRGLWNDKLVGQVFIVNEFVRRVVATVDNLPRQKLALRLMPVKQVPGPFRISGKSDELTVHPENAARYGLYIKVLEAVDSAQLVDAYRRFYPLFQQAYEDLGYPKGYFNDRLVEVIDHLLAAPEMPANARLVQPKVFYQFADPDLERRSAGQKIMMRIGSENAARVKAKLREIRGLLVREQVKPPPQKTPVGR